MQADPESSPCKFSLRRSSGGGGANYTTPLIWEPSGGAIDELEISAFKDLSLERLTDRISFAETASWEPSRTFPSRPFQLIAKAEIHARGHFNKSSFTMEAPNNRDGKPSYRPGTGAYRVVHVQNSNSVCGQLILDEGHAYRTSSRDRTQLGLPDRGRRIIFSGKELKHL